MTTESAPSGNNAQPHPVFWMTQSRPVLSVHAGPGASAQAIVAEIDACASRFAETGEETSIDLRCLKAMPEEREILATLLGRGEVSAVVGAIGRSEIYETSIPCVWWVRHRNTEDEIVGEFIEITEVPDVLMGDRKAVAQGLEMQRITWPFRTQREAAVKT